MPILVGLVEAIAMYKSQPPPKRTDRDHAESAETTTQTDAASFVQSLQSLGPVTSIHTSGKEGSGSQPNVASSNAIEKEFVQGSATSSVEAHANIAGKEERRSQPNVITSSDVIAREPERSQSVAHPRCTMPVVATSTSPSRCRVNDSGGICHVECICRGASGSHELRAHNVVSSTPFSQDTPNPMCVNMHTGTTLPRSQSHSQRQFEPTATRRVVEACTDLASNSPIADTFVAQHRPMVSQAALHSISQGIANSHEQIPMFSEAMPSPEEMPLGRRITALQVYERP